MVTPFGKDVRFSLVISLFSSLPLSFSLCPIPSISLSCRILIGCHLFTCKKLDPPNTPIYLEHRMFLRAFPMPVVCHQQIRNTQMFFVVVVGAFIGIGFTLSVSKRFQNMLVGECALHCNVCFSRLFKFFMQSNYFKLCVFIYSLVVLCVCSEF